MELHISKSYVCILAISLFISTFTNNMATAAPASNKSKKKPSKVEKKQLSEISQSNVLIQKGVKVVFTAEGFRPYSANHQARQGEDALIKFRITDASTGAPVTALKPAAWLDLEKPEGTDPLKGMSMSCKEKVQSYLRGSFGFRPDIDLNSYFILSLNHDASISIIDPILGISGYTNLYGSILLRRPGEDWLMMDERKLLLVTMPKAGQAAVIDTEKFKVVDNVEAGANPSRIALQPDNKYVWIGNDALLPHQSGVTAIDSLSRKVVAFIPTGAGHHEIAFSPDSLFAFVTNKEEGTVSVIDTQLLRKVNDLKTGEKPVAISSSKLSNSIYIAHQGDGTVSVIDAKALRIATRIETKPGISTIRFAPGERWGFVTNAAEDRVYIIDASSNTIRHIVEVGKEPDKVSFSDKYAYIRAKGVSDVYLIQLGNLTKDMPLLATKVGLGQKSPSESPYHSPADAIVPTGESDTVLVTNPGDAAIYYYMEGMVASMGSFANFGSIPKAAAVVVRNLREKEKGEYSVKVRIPESGKYEVAFAIDSPWLIHCFNFDVEPNAELQARKVDNRYSLNFVSKETNLKVGQKYRLQFNLTNPAIAENKPVAAEVRVLASMVPGSWTERYRAQPHDGLYEVEVTPPSAGVYYLFFEVPSLNLRFNQLPSLILQATDEPKATEESTGSSLQLKKMN